MSRLAIGAASDGPRIERTNVFKNPSLDHW